MRLFKLLGILSFCFPVFAASSSIPDEICALLPSSLPTPKPSKLWVVRVDTLPTLTAETYKVIVHQFTHYAESYKATRDCKMRYLRCIPESLLFVTPDGSATIITIPDRIFLSQDNVHYYQSSARLFSENPPVITDDEITFYDHRYQKKELPHVASLCFFYLPADRLAFYKILEHKPKEDVFNLLYVKSPLTPGLYAYYGKQVPLKQKGEMHRIGEINRQTIAYTPDDLVNFSLQYDHPVFHYDSDSFFSYGTLETLNIPNLDYGQFRIHEFHSTH